MSKNFRQFVITVGVVVVALAASYLLGRAGWPFSSENADKAFRSAFPEAVAESVAQRSPQDEIRSSRQNAITRAVSRVSPAVVGINVTEVREYADPFYQFFGDDPFLRRFFGDRTIRQKVRALGSGFIISPDGYIVTNDHVAGNAAEITVTMTDGRRISARLVGTDPVTDVALLKVDKDNLPYLSLGDSEGIIVGEWAIAFGNPFGLFEINDKPTVTVGVISSLGMNLGRVDDHLYRDMIETDAAINGGNSGGPLVDANGDVVGMNTLIFTGGQSTTYVGYGFAIPINRIKKVVSELKRNGKVDRNASVGFQVQDVDLRIARILGMSKVAGVIVSEVRRGGAADKAGLKEGDVILAINGQQIGSEVDLYALITDAKPGETWEMQVFRDRKTITITMKLERRSD